MEVATQEQRDELLDLLFHEKVDEFNAWRKEHLDLVLDFSGAKLRMLDLRGVNLSGANLAEADLTGAVLEGANLAEADLTGAKVKGVKLWGSAPWRVKGLPWEVFNRWVREAAQD